MTTSNARTRVLLVVLVIVAAYVLLWRPQASKLAEARDRRISAELTLSNVQTEFAAATAEPAETASDPTAEARLRAVPAEPELSTLLRSLDSLAVATGLELASIMPSSPTDNGDGIGRSIQILVTGAGTRGAAYDFVAGLQAFERLVVVEQIDLTDQATDDGTTPPGVQLQMTIRAYIATGTVSPDADVAANPGATTPSD